MPFETKSSGLIIKGGFKIDGCKIGGLPYVYRCSYFVIADIQSHSRCAQNYRTLDVIDTCCQELGTAEIWCVIQVLMCTCTTCTWIVRKLWQMVTLVCTSQVKSIWGNEIQQIKEQVSNFHDFYFQCPQMVSTTTKEASSCYDVNNYKFTANHTFNKSKLIPVTPDQFWAVRHKICR